MTRQAILVVMSASVVGGAAIAYYYYTKRRQQTKLPEQWTEVGTLEDIYVYPVKSCGPVAREQVEISILGPKYGWLRDRVLMVVNEKDNFVTARAYPELLLVTPSVSGSVLTLSFPKMEQLKVDLAEVRQLKTKSTAYVWSVPVPVYDCGWEAAEWFSRILDKSTLSFRLVYYASEKSRELRQSTNPLYKFTKNDTGALPDEVPFNLINEASVEDLNTRLATSVKHNNFRPNFVLKGAQAYDEDNWKFVKIGDHVFEIIKACTRCIMTTIDPETGIKSSEGEPLNTLKSYRQLSSPEERRSAGNSPRMGVQMALRSAPGGVVSLRDKIYVA